MAEKPALAAGWQALIREWVRALKADNKSENTIEIYERAATQLAQWLRANGHDTPPQDVTASHVRDFIADTIDRTSAGNAATAFRSLRTWFGWLIDEDEITKTPMAKLKAPFVPEQPIPLVSDDVTKRLLDSCKGTDLLSRRDAAIIRLYFDTGCRLSEIANLVLDDVDLDLDVVRVLGKGRKPRAVPFSAKTGQAIGRYLRVRDRSKHAATTSAVWIGDRGRGPLSPNGIKLMLRRRGKAIGMSDGNLHAHRFRHSAAVAWRRKGGDTTSMKRIFGWKSDAMVARYGLAAADEVAEQHARELNLGDRL